MLLLYASIQLFFCFSLMTGADNARRPQTEDFRLIKKDNQPTTELSILVTLLDIEHNGTLKSIIAQTQKHWLRAKEIERSQINAHPTDLQRHARQMYEKQCLAISRLLSSIGTVHAVRPIQQEYDYILFNGGPSKYLRPRMQTLLYALNKCSIKRIVFLTGEVPLDTTVKPLAKQVEELLIDCTDTSNPELPEPLPNNEYTINHMAFNVAQLPEQWADKKVQYITQQEPYIERDQDNVAEFVRTPMQGNTRPNTADTFNLWLRSKPKPGSCIAISNQPFIGYQHEVARSILPKNFTLETIGADDFPVTKDKILIHLDTIARWLYIARK